MNKIADLALDWLSRRAEEWIEEKLGHKTAAGLEL